MTKGLPFAAALLLASCGPPPVRPSLAERIEAVSAAQRDLEAERRAEREYQEQLRALRLRQLQARVERENEFLDRALKRQDAETDTVQSVADANRASPEGAGARMKALKLPPAKRDGEDGLGE